MSTNNRVINLNLQFLEAYLNAYSPVTMEARLPYDGIPNQKRWADEIRPYVDEVYSTEYGNVYAVINKDAEYTVVFEGHADEISWRVGHIDENGRMYLIRNGGADHMVAAGDTGLIHVKGGPIPVIFPFPAIHLRAGSVDTDKEFKLTSHTVHADAGLTLEQLTEKGVKVGSIITHDGKFGHLGNYIKARALDNRIGGFALVEIARYLKEFGIKLPYRLIFLNSAQEEVGLKGATMFTNTFAGKINVAVCMDVCHATKNYPYIVSPTQHGVYEMGKGPVLMYSNTMHPMLNELLENVAKEQSIPHQFHALSNFSGTDTDPFQIRGIPSTLISFAIENMHTQVEKMSLEDVRLTVLLMLGLAEKLADEKNRDFMPLKF